MGRPCSRDLDVVLWAVHSSGEAGGPVPQPHPQATPSSNTTTLRQLWCVAPHQPHLAAAVAELGVAEGAVHLVAALLRMRCLGQIKQRGVGGKLTCRPAWPSLCGGLMPSTCRHTDT